MQTGTLFVVATPIGNMEDITLRALRVLKEADVIVCEDTRVAKKLLFHHKISRSLLPVSQRPDEGKVRRVLDALGAGKNIALITDAGTPGVSDPGGLLVKAVAESGYTVSPVPGPSALGAIVSVAGIDMKEFLFLGFPPHKKGRKTLVARVVESTVPVVLYESKHRMQKLLDEIIAADPSGAVRIILGRELTKMHEEIVRGSAQEVLAYLQSDAGKMKGEFVCIVYKA